VVGEGIGFFVVGIIFCGAGEIGEFEAFVAGVDCF